MILCTVSDSETLIQNGCKCLNFILLSFDELRRIGREQYYMQPLNIVLYLYNNYDIVCVSITQQLSNTRHDAQKTNNRTSNRNFLNNNSFEWYLICSEITHSNRNLLRNSSFERNFLRKNSSYEQEFAQK